MSFLKGAITIANASSRQIIDVWAQPVFKDGLLPEVVRVFEQSGSAHLLGLDLSAAQLIEMMDKVGVDRAMLCAWPAPGTWVVSDEVALTFPEFSAHLLGVTPTCHWLEYLNHVGPILTEPVRIKDGHALIPDRPGSGLEWNEEEIQRWLAHS